MDTTITTPLNSDLIGNVLSKAPGCDAKQVGELVLQALAQSSSDPSKVELQAVKRLLAQALVAFKKHASAGSGTHAA